MCTGTNGWKAMDALGVADSLRHKFVAIEQYDLHL